MGSRSVTDPRRAAADNARDYSRSVVAMDTFISVHARSAHPADQVAEALRRALAWFDAVERTCSRFDPESEMVRLCGRPGEAVPLSDLLFEAVSFSLEVASITHGAFDPTVGGAQRARGFTAHYVSRRSVETKAGRGCYRDVQVDADRRIVTLRRPLLLDLGGVAKGLAIDLAARELAGLERYAVEAGGDLFAGGAEPSMAAWRVGVQHPTRDALLGALTVRNLAVCTSGGGERPANGDGEHHLLDPRTGRSPRAVAGATVVAPSAMVADALATAAFVLGPKAGMQVLAEQDMDGVIVTPNGEARLTPNLERDLSWTATQD